MGGIDWWAVWRILQNPNERFVCCEQDPPDIHRASFVAQDLVQRILEDPEIGGAVYSQAADEAGPVPTYHVSFMADRPSGVIASDKGAYLEWAHRRLCVAVLRCALRLHERERKAAQRDATRTLSLDCPMSEDGTLSLHDVLAHGETSDDVSDTLDALALTARQRQVADLLAQGYLQTDVANILSISPGRVSQIVDGIGRKLRR